MSKSKRKTSSFKFSKKWLFSITILILALFMFSGIAVFLQSRNNNQSFLIIKSKFENYAKDYNAEVLEKNNLSVWWINPDNLNIINDNSSGIEFDLNVCESDLESKSLFKKTALILGQKINVIMEQNGFKINQQNSSKSIADEQFYDYIQAYEKNPLKCVFVANPDCGKLTGEAKMHYTFSFSCTDQFAKNYQEQAPYLKDLKIKDAIIHVEKRVGDFVKLNVNYRRSGYFTAAKLVNGKWQELYSGQDNPSCEIVNKYKIPKEILPDCYPDNL